MVISRRSTWQNPLFQIPLILLLTCLVLAALLGIFDIGRPKVSVAIALDLSRSTYEGNTFNAPNTVMAKEVEAVKSYLKENEKIRTDPKQIQIFGFGERVKSLTNGFQENIRDVEQNLEKALQDPQLPTQVVSHVVDINSTNSTIQQTTRALSKVSDRCREILLVTQGSAPVSQSVIDEARNSKVKINAVVFGETKTVDTVDTIKRAADDTGGTYISGEDNKIETLNSNWKWKWIIVLLSAAWIFLMWMLILPLDRIFQKNLKINMTLAGQLAIGNALFWTVATLVAVWELLGQQLFSYC